jgi:hypothetical protein
MARKTEINKETVYEHDKLKPPRKDDFFVATGETKFGGGYMETGYFDHARQASAEKEHGDNLLHKTCPNRRGYYCTQEMCKYPKCLVDKQSKK